MTTTIERARMYLERLQVEEGFLDGLDVTFSPGLNVIVGARGTGKTSLIELIRYAIGAPAFTEEALTRGNAQAVSVLQGGRVAVTIRSESSTEVIERDAGTPLDGQPNLRINCTVLAQNEIEAIGAQPLGRLHLLDRFRPQRFRQEAKLLENQRLVESQTTQLLNLVKEGLDLADQRQALDGTIEQLADAMAEQNGILGTAQATEPDRLKLTELQNLARDLGTQRNVLKRADEQIRALRQELRVMLDRGEGLLEEWPLEARQPDLLIDARAQMRTARQLLEQAARKVEEAEKTTDRVSREVLAREARLVETSRDLRQRLEALQIGASSITRKVATLQERAGQLQALRSLLQERRQQFLALQDQRDSTYRWMESHQQDIFEERRNVAAMLTSSLAPTIRVSVQKSTQIDAYASAIAGSLRGSGLHYNSLAPMLAERLSPLELVRAAENFDVSELSLVAGMAEDRAQAVLSAIRGGGTASIAGSTIPDSVQLELLDGMEYKSTEALSIGQRCTVVLPLLLSHRGDPLLVDQPEDHLDNAFIVSTLVKALKRRDPGDQFVFASHNANIPVLGEADRVIVMESDGRRGFVAHAGSLDDPVIVRHISTIMEGGASAFKARAQFYSHGHITQ